MGAANDGSMLKQRAAILASDETVTIDALVIYEDNIMEDRTWKVIGYDAPFYSLYDQVKLGLEDKDFEFNGQFIAPRSWRSWRSWRSFGRPGAMRTLSHGPTAQKGGSHRSSPWRNGLVPSRNPCCGASWTPPRMKLLSMCSLGAQTPFLLSRWIAMSVALGGRPSMRLMGLSCYCQTCRSWSARTETETETETETFPHSHATPAGLRT
jgi:hypothetical protein